LRNILKLIFLLVFLTSCSSDKKDIKDAVSVFKYSLELKKDDSLGLEAVDIPVRRQNRFWYGSTKVTRGLDSVENFAFPSKITKTKSIWSGYRTGSNDKKVFKPVISNNVIYLLDAKGNLIARDIRNYKKIWKKRIFAKKDKRDFRGGKIFLGKGNIIFATTGFNSLVALNSKNGEIIWSKKLGSIPISTPVSNEGQVFVTTSDNKTYALDAQNGTINWIHEGIYKNTAILGAADPVFYKNYLIASYSSGEIYIINQISGEVGWVYDLNVSKAINSDFILNDIDATPIVKDDIVYVIGNGGLMMAIKAKDGNIVWRKELASISDFWIAGNFIYLINNDNQLICMHRKNGGIKWYKNLDKNKKSKKKTIYHGIVMAGDNLILSNSKREIVIVSPLDGKIIQKKKVSRQINHAPIIVNKKLYLNTLGRFTVDLIVMGSAESLKK
jgi:outer membrane protein assembly factor BamB